MKKRKSSSTVVRTPADRLAGLALGWNVVTTVAVMGVSVHHVSHGLSEITGDSMPICVAIAVAVDGSIIGGELAAIQSVKGARVSVYTGVILSMAANLAYVSAGKSGLELGVAAAVAVALPFLVLRGGDMVAKLISK